MSKSRVKPSVKPLEPVGIYCFACIFTATPPTICGVSMVVIMPVLSADAVLQGVVRDIWIRMSIHSLDYEP